MNILQDLEYSLIILLLYVILRSTIRDRFGGEEAKKSTPVIIILIGAMILIFINRTIGILIIVLGVALVLIPEKNKDGLETGD